MTEDHQVFHASTVFFSGSKVPQRRALSIGPGIYSRFGDHLEDDEDAEELEGGWEAIRRQSGPHPHHVQPASVVQESNNAEAGPSSPRAGAPSPAPIQRESTTSSHSTVDSFSYPEHRRENRRFSVDATHIRSRPPYETRQISRGLSPRELEELAPGIFVILNVSIRHFFRLNLHKSVQANRTSHGNYKYNSPHIGGTHIGVAVISESTRFLFPFAS